MNKPSRRGTAYVEFLIVFWPLMLLWLGLTQIGILYGVHILVNHAAAKAARAAIVILPDEEDRYEGDEPLTILQDTDDGDDDSLDAYKKATRGGRLDTIRNAARIPLAAVSPSLDIPVDGALVDLLAGWTWTEYAVAVTFPGPDGIFLTKFDQTGALTTRVTYLYKCPVPIISKIICHQYWSSPNGIARDSQGNLKRFQSGNDSEAIKILNTVDASILSGVGKAIKLGIGTEKNWRFMVIEAMRTLPMQGQHK
ncbi:MAG: hypothetical protein GY762_16975 [Proteobacteria bacterium]|nr:hypothetical protein [Pseudomonadota bacterium]